MPFYQIPAREGSFLGAVLHFPQFFAEVSHCQPLTTYGIRFSLFSPFHVHLMFFPDPKNHPYPFAPHLFDDQQHFAL